MTFDRKTYRLRHDQYFPEAQKKDLIVLHFTAGTTVAGVHATWTAPVNTRQQRVATAYVVDLDGTIHEFFPPECWAYHLGMKTGNPAWIQDRRSIGIEIVNPGPLRLDSMDRNRLNWYPGNFTTRWCNTAEGAKYVASSFRGFDYYASFPEVQQEAVRGLVSDLADRFQIPRVLAPEARREDCDVDFYQQFQGIASHQNFRADKMDIGPAWDWYAFEKSLERA